MMMARFLTENFANILGNITLTLSFLFLSFSPFLFPFSDEILSDSDKIALFGQIDTHGTMNIRFYFILFYVILFYFLFYFKWGIPN